MERVTSIISNRTVLATFTTVGCAGIILQTSDLALSAKGQPTILSPLPLFTVIWDFIIGPGAAFLPPLAFCLWSIHLFKGKAKVPMRTLIALGVLIVLDIIDLYYSWPYGLKYQGKSFTVTMNGINGAFILLLLVITVWAVRRASFIGNLLVHFILFLWLGWYAFLYLGELP
jgi:hypothetical protein